MYFSHSIYFRCPGEGGGGFLGIILFSSVGFHIKEIKDDHYFSMIDAKLFVNHFRTNQ